MEKITRSLSTEAARERREWYIVDADGQALGRLASRVASVLRGKNNRQFTPHVDCGGFVVVVNAAKVKLTGNKAQGKIYQRHTGFPGGVREETAGSLRARRPEELIHQAVVGMLPHNRLGRQLATKLKVYAGPEHPHAAQRPAPLPV
jgi:large subunit ribosomal protein L13